MDVCGSWNITKQKKIEKKRSNAMQSIKSPPPWYGSGYFLLKNIIMHLLLKMKKKNTHSLNGLQFNQCISII